VLEDEVRQILRDLIEELGAVSAQITQDPDARGGVPARTRPLGDGDFLRVELGTRSRAGETPNRRSTGDREAVDAALERAARQLRAAARRWEASLAPMIVGNGTPEADKVRERIDEYLAALAAIGQVDNALLVVKGQVVASGRPRGELEDARWPFIVRRLAAARVPGSSHGEIADPDFYAVEFWYGAALVVYARPPYAVDFVRFRCRQVTRELAHLLPLLEPEPPSPAAIRPPGE
jgi:hypothetical protein